jgi:hypothetical protein
MARPSKVSPAREAEVAAAEARPLVNWRLACSATRCLELGSRCTLWPMSARQSTLSAPVVAVPRSGACSMMGLMANAGAGRSTSGEVIFSSTKSPPWNRLARWVAVMALP